MNEEYNYLEDRLADQQEWHSKKAITSKQNYHRVELITIIAGASIPVINVIEFSFISDSSIRLISASIGALIVVAAGISKLSNFRRIGSITAHCLKPLRESKSFFASKSGIMMSAAIRNA